MEEKLIMNYEDDINCINAFRDSNEHLRKYFERIADIPGTNEYVEKIGHALLAVLLRPKSRAHVVFEEFLERVITKGQVSLGPGLIHKMIKSLFERKLNAAMARFLDFLLDQNYVLTDNTKKYVQR